MWLWYRGFIVKAAVPQGSTSHTFNSALVNDCQLLVTRAESYNESEQMRRKPRLVNSARP
jgi:hypothetical protein